MDPAQIAQIVGAVIDQKMGSRLGGLETKQAETDQVIQSLPALVQQIQAMITQQVQEAMQQVQAPVAPTAPQVAPVVLNSPPVKEDQTIPCGITLAKPQAQMPVPQPQAQTPVPQPQVQPSQQQPQKASEIWAQMFQRGDQQQGQAPAGGLAQLMQFKELFSGGEEEKKTPPPTMMDQLSGMGAVMAQFTDFFKGVMGTMNSFRSDVMGENLQQAQIDKIRAETEATVLRALTGAKQIEAKKPKTTTKAATKGKT